MLEFSKCQLYYSPSRASHVWRGGPDSLSAPGSWGPRIQKPHPGSLGSGVVAAQALLGASAWRLRNRLDGTHTYL